MPSAASSRRLRSSLHWSSRWSSPMDDRDFLAAFEACAIGNADFHHRDHIRLAWIYLRRFPVIEAIERFTTSLKRFAEHHGKPMLYHETIVVHDVEVIERRAGEDAAAICVAGHPLRTKSVRQRERER